MSTRIAVVTGAASGMGRCAAERLVRSGWTVAAVDLPGVRLEELGAQAGVTAVPCDVTDAAQVTATSEEVVQRFGGVTRLVNAAGICLRGRIDELPAEAFHQSMAVNYLGTVHWVKAVLPVMQQRGRGEIALFASLAGWMPTPAMAAYTATKFAVVGFAETLGMELRGTGVKLRCVCPAAVQTPMLDTIMGQGVPERLKKLGGVSTPELVIDAIEKSLGGRRTFGYVFPGGSTRLLYHLRRIAPAPLGFGVRVLNG
jgi:NAD(P)-dependent dehydrogenase (short-subunit alcohol dehydrogenase family)